MSINNQDKIRLLLYIAKYDYSKDIQPLAEKEEFKTFSPLYD